MAFSFADDVRSALRACYSATEIDELEAALATPAAALHVRCNLLRCSREALMSSLHAEFKTQYAIDVHAALHDVVVIRRRPCDDSLAPLLELERAGIASLSSAARFAKRRDSGIPPHECVVDRHCAEAVLKGADIFVKGVCGASAGLTAGQQVSVYADIHGRLLRGSICDRLEGMPLLGVGECCLERAALFRETSGLAIRMRHITAGDLPPLRNLLEGTLYVQSLPSLVAAHVLGARPPMSVLDACAAPGSKTTHIGSK